MSKKLIMSTGVALAATAAVLGQHIVEAEEVQTLSYSEGNAPEVSVPEVNAPEVTVTATATSQATSQTESNQVTKEQVDTAKKDYDTAQEEQVAQEQIVSEVNQTVSESEDKLKAAEAEVTNAEQQIELIENAPELIELKKKEISDQQNVIATEEVKLDSAKQSTVDALAELKTAETKKSDADKAVANAENDVKKAEEKLSGTGIDFAQQQIEKHQSQSDSLKKEISTLKQTIADKEKELETAKNTLTTVTETAQKELNDEISKKEAELKAKEAELASLPESTSVIGTNKITLPASYKTTALPLLKKIEAAGYTTHPNYNATANQYKSEIDNASQLSEYGFYGYKNQYQSIEADKNRVVDPSNLSTEVQDELAQFAAEIINGVRSELGLTKVTVTRSAQDFAKKVVAAYNQKNVPFLTHDDVHYEVAQSMGLNYYDDRGYESIGTTFSKGSTVDELKRSYYQSIVFFLFNDSSSLFGHTISMLQSGSQNYYLGVSPRVTTNGLQNQFLMVPENNIKSSTFSKKSIGNEVVDNTAKINELKTAIAELKTTISNLKQLDIKSNPNVIEATQKVDDLVDDLDKDLTDLNDQLTISELNVQSLEKQIKFAELELQNLLTQPENKDIVNEINTAKDDLKKAEANQTSAQKEVEKKQVVYQTALDEEQKQAEKVEEEKKKLVELESYIEELEKLVKEGDVIKEKLPGLKEKVEELKTILEKDKKALADANKLLEEKVEETNRTKAEYERLLELYNLQSNYSFIRLPDGSIIKIPKPSPALPQSPAELPTNGGSSNSGGNDTIGTGAGEGNSQTNETSLQGVISEKTPSSTVEAKALTAKVSQTQSSNQEKASQTLPTTGAESSVALTVIGMLSLAAISRKSRKNEFE
ncbi:TPA: SEC10/PgrA surface exclusion domain-containing protein [Streptococcus suis]